MWRFWWREEEEMAYNALKHLTIILLIATTSVAALVGPDGVTLSSERRRELSTCPSSCFCSSEAVQCERWQGGQNLTVENFTLPSRTRTLSFRYLPDGHIDASRILRSLHSLQWLRISQGYLVEIPSFPTLQSLNFLDLSNNKITSISSHAFNGITHIVHLNISGNRLRYVSASSLQGLSDLKELDLSRNPSLLQIPVDLFKPLAGLKFLDISGANVEELNIQWLSYLPQLSFLNISHNNIESLPHLRLLSLEILDASNNPLTSQPHLRDLPELRYLSLSHTQISYLNASDTEGCSQLKVLHLGNTNLTNLNEGILSHCRSLEEIDLSQNFNLWRIEHGTFSNLEQLTILRLDNCPNLYDIEEDAFNGLVSLRELYFQNSGVKVIPYSLTHLNNLTLLNLEGITLLCDCYSYWLPSLLTSFKHLHWKGVNVIRCSDGINRTPQDIANHLKTLQCSEVKANTQSNQWILTLWGKSALLECNVTGYPTPNIIWETADQQLHVYNKSINDHPWMKHQISAALSIAKAGTDGKFQVLESGQLLIRHVTRLDIGRYKCFAFNPVSNSSVVTFLGLDDSEVRAFILESIMFGIACSVLFLLTTLIVQFIRYIMDRFGLECCCCKNRLSPRAKQIRTLIENVESYKRIQLEKLRENYASQVANIKDSCYQQMERLRDSYATQSKNLKDLCDYSTQQFSGARDQYLDQVNKIRDYSMSQMNRVRENYVFQRNRIRKFSGHQLLRLRETYKYQQKTLNKLLETLPDLYIQNCRTGTCQRTDSIVFDNLDGLDVYYKVDFLDSQSYNSDYYTPNSTLTRNSKVPKWHHSRNTSSASGGTEYLETHSWLTRQDSSGSDKEKEANTHHQRSLSISANPSAHQRRESVSSHKRSISASSHPSPHLFLPKSPLLEENGDCASPLTAPTTPISSRETPLYTPLTLTPVHNPTPFPKSFVDTLTERSKLNVEKSLPDQGTEAIPEPIDNAKIEVQNIKISCDSAFAECRINCDNEERTQTVEVDAKTAHETSL